MWRFGLAYDSQVTTPFLKFSLFRKQGSSGSQCDSQSSWHYTPWICREIPYVRCCLLGRIFWHGHVVMLYCFAPTFLRPWLEKSGSKQGIMQANTQIG